MLNHPHKTTILSQQLIQPNIYNTQPAQNNKQICKLSPMYNILPLLHSCYRAVFSAQSCTSHLLPILSLSLATSSYQIVSTRPWWRGPQVCLCSKRWWCVLFPLLPEAEVCCLLLCHPPEANTFSGPALDTSSDHVMVWATRGFETNTWGYQREHLFEQAAEGFTVTPV